MGGRIFLDEIIRSAEDLLFVGVFGSTDSTAEFVLSPDSFSFGVPG